MASNQTSNYGLNQWEATDQVLRTDFNADNDKIDAALKGLAEKDTALEGTLTGQAAAIAKLGNCRIETFTYTGTGTAGAGSPTRLNFCRPPLAVALYSMYNQIILIQGQTRYPILTRPVSNSTQVSMAEMTVTWSGNQVSFYHYETPRYQFNEKDRDYWGFVLFAMDE